jgi:hypothetical protein
MCAMSKKQHPEYHKTLLDPATHPAATRRIRFEESRNSYFYRTGEKVYKIRKTSHIYSHPAIKERYAQEALRLGRFWGGAVVQAVVPIVASGEGYALGGQGTPVDYALCLAQLSDHHWMGTLLQQGKLTPTAVGRLARFLAEHHQQGALDEKDAATVGRPEHVEALLEEVFYQCRKYVDQTLSQAMLDMVTRPLAKFLEESRKLFLRRQKRARLVDGHGAFVPEHIHLRGMEVCAIAPLDAQQKYRRLDAANDLALLMNELARREAGEIAELFLKRYVTAAKDRDLARILPAYRTLQAMRSGLSHSEWMAELPPEDPQRKEQAAVAHSYFNLAVVNARQIPRPA